jgi:hypothetical protein
VPGQDNPGCLIQTDSLTNRAQDDDDGEQYRAPAELKWKAETTRICIVFSSKAFFQDTNIRKGLFTIW